MVMCTVANRTSISSQKKNRTAICVVKVKVQFLSEVPCLQLSEVPPASQSHRVTFAFSVGKGPIFTCALNLSAPFNFHH
jgi:hypothetical protein